MAATASSEKIFSVRAGDQKALRDVVRRLLGGDRVGPGPQRDSLPQLAHIGSAQLLFEFGLAGENDLHQLLRGRLQVGEQANLFQQLPLQVLRLVDDDDAGLFAAVTLDQPAVELDQHARLGAVLRR